MHFGSSVYVPVFSWERINLLHSRHQVHCSQPENAQAQRPFTKRGCKENAPEKETCKRQICHGLDAYKLITDHKELETCMVEGKCWIKTEGLLRRAVKACYYLIHWSQGCGKSPVGRDVH